jgi:hypothetical protein
VATLSVSDTKPEREKILEEFPPAGLVRCLISVGKGYLETARDYGPRTPALANKKGSLPLFRPLVQNQRDKSRTFPF